MIAYIGGKFRQSKWIYENIKSELPKKTYAEPFSGAFWVYIQTDIYKQADNIIYNDYNSFMVNLFSCFSNYKNFLPIVEKMEAQNVEKFQECKNFILNNKNNIDFPNYELGSCYLYVVTQTFSGVMSEKAKMVDLKGKYKSKFYSSIERMNKPKIQKKLEKIKVKNKSYEDVISELDDKNTLLYLDPPYYGTENYYGFHDFGIKDHEKLSNILNNCNSKWALSYYEFDDMKKWYPKSKYKWKTKEYKKAAAAKNGEKQNIGNEILIMNF